MSEVRIQDQVYDLALLTSGSCRSQTLTMSEAQCYAVFGSISEVHEFVARAASRYGLQGSVRDEGEFVIVDLRPEKR